MMKVPIVVSRNDVRYEIGQVDVYADSFRAGIPKDLKLDLDFAILSGQVELQLVIKE